MCVCVCVRACERDREGRCVLLNDSHNTSEITSDFE